MLQYLYIQKDGLLVFYLVNKQVDKYPKRYDDLLSDKGATDDDIFEKDLALKQIPVRELFVDAYYIIQHFHDTNDFHSGLKGFLEQMRISSNLLMDFQTIAKPGEDNCMSIIDLSYTKGAKEIDTETGSPIDEKDIFEDMFMFDLSSGNSVVKEFNLELKIPDGALGNMLAIQGISPDNQLLVVSPQDDELLSLQELFESDQESNFHVKYMPEVSSYQSRATEKQLGLMKSQEEIYRSIQSKKVQGIMSIGESGYTVNNVSGLINFPDFSTYKSKMAESKQPKKDRFEANLSIVNKQEKLMMDEGIEIP